MRLKSLEVRNYRSLENLSLPNLGLLNVLIGRNNSGKTAILSAMSALRVALFGGGEIEWANVLTAMDQTRRWEMKLAFALESANRTQLMQLLGDSGMDEARVAQIQSSPFARLVEFTFRSPSGAANLMHLQETRLLTEGNRWATIQRKREEDTVSNPLSDSVNLAAIGKVSGGKSFDTAQLDLASGQSISQIRIQAGNWSQFTHSDPVTGAIFKSLTSYFQRAFFFSPFRHSTRRMQSRETVELSADGTNLAAYLHTIHNNHPPTFRLIEEFVQTALPEVGDLTTPMAGTETEVAFLTPEGFSIRLHDMGGGVEQLLMVATVLLTTGNDSTIFLEEPESHLHPGAQRYLIDRLSGSNRQVFIATHSPIFVNFPQDKAIYQVKSVGNRTLARQVSHLDLLASTLTDIGSRPSDVLFSDAVVFVEGQSDADALIVWSDALRKPLRTHNIRLILMGGGQAYAATIRSEALMGITEQTPIPHLFVLDRDERTVSEIDRIEGLLGQRVHFLKRRELENYFLAPTTIMKALKSKAKDIGDTLDGITNASADQISHMVAELVESMYGLVLMKRIRAEIGGIRGGLISREMATELAAQANNQNLARVIQDRVNSRLHSHTERLELQQLVNEQKNKLDKEWRDEKLRLSLAPAEEILAVIFQRFGTRYEKPQDAKRLASAMTEREIPAEINGLVEKIWALPHSLPTAK